MFRQPRMFECVMIGGPTPDDARELSRMLRYEVNLIPLNAAPEIPLRGPRTTLFSAFRKSSCAKEPQHSFAGIAATMYPERADN
jgi:hypothetical protein